MNKASKKRPQTFGFFFSEVFAVHEISTHRHMDKLVNQHQSIVFVNDYMKKKPIYFTYALFFFTIIFFIIRNVERHAP